MKICVLLDNLIIGMVFVDLILYYMVSQNGISIFYIVQLLPIVTEWHDVTTVVVFRLHMLY